MIHLTVSVADQALCVFDHDDLIKTYLIGTAMKGIGQAFGSFQTPLGKHIVRAKIGDNEPDNSVFVRRRPTGEIYQPSLKTQFPDRDWILTRIMWLSGCEVGHNRLGKVDTMRRFIYIHGCPDEAVMGVPSSRGCVRMHNADIKELFDLIKVGTPVLITRK